MRAARSDSAEDRLEAAADRLVERGALRQALGPAEDGGERVVQLVRDTGNRLAERRHFLRLQQLVIDVARLVVQLLALADVADERLHAQAAVGGRRVGAAVSSTHTGALIGAAQAQQVVGDRAVGAQPFEQRDARLRIDEAIAVERPHVGLRRFARVAEDELEMGIGGDGRRRHRGRGSRCRRLHERLRTAARTPRRGDPRGDYRARCGCICRRCAGINGCNSVTSDYSASASAYGRLEAGSNSFSFAARMSRTEAPEACICIASRATSMQTAQVHAVRIPLRDVARWRCARRRSNRRCRGGPRARSRRSTARS